MNIDTLLLDLAGLPTPPPHWQLPAPTELGAHGLAPTRLLVELERQTPAVVIMSAGQLQRLLDFPALALSDLSHLHRVLFISQAPEDVQLVGRAMEALGCQVQGFANTNGQWQDLTLLQSEYEHWRQRALGHPQVNSVAIHGQTLFAVANICSAESLHDPLTATGLALGQRFCVEQLNEAVALNDRLASAALLSMLNGLDHCGLLPALVDDVAQRLADAGIAPGHRLLIARWLDVLQEQGLLQRQSDRLIPMPAATQWSDEALENLWATLAQDWASNTGGGGTIDYARDNARQLPALMRGDCAAVHLLFPEGRTDRAAALYRESLAAQYQHAAVAHWIGAWAARQSTAEPLRILEVGAGTGSTTQAVLPMLMGASVDYLCTDVSAYFSQQAAQRLQHLPWVRHGVFDIDQPALAQGYSTQRWDLIVAGGVLNATRDTGRSLSTLFSLLKPGGWLVFSEPTQEEFWVMASQAFMLNHASDERQHSSATFLDLSQWQRALLRAGFQGNHSLPETDHPLARLGHRVFVAQVPPQRLSRAALAEHLAHPALHLELPDHLPDAEALAQWAAISTIKDFT